MDEVIETVDEAADVVDTLTKKDLQELLGNMLPQLFEAASWSVQVALAQLLENKILTGSASARHIQEGVFKALIAMCEGAANPGYMLQHKAATMEDVRRRQAPAEETPATEAPAEEPGKIIL